MRRYVTAKPLQEHTTASFYDYVLGLYKPPDVLPDAKAALGIRISKTKKGLLNVRCKREVKQLTEAEVVGLAAEYQLDVEELTQALTKRKFAITNQEGQQTNVKPRTTGRRGKPRKANEADAHLRAFAERQAGSEDQLQQSVADTDVHAQGILQPELGTPLE